MRLLSVKYQWVYLAGVIVLSGLGLSACVNGSTPPESGGATATQPQVPQPSLPYTPVVTPTLHITPTPTPTRTPQPTSTPIAVQWRPVGAGISQSHIPVDLPDGDGTSIVYAYRLDPQKVKFRVRYDSTEPHTIEDWLAITGADIVINGGYFATSTAPMGRIIVDGRMFGVPLDYGNDSIGVPGLFASTGDVAEIYALGRESYNPRGMRFDQAIECYPLLLLPGGQPTFPIDTGKLARRTVIGIDEDGQVVILVSNIDVFSLYNLSEWLSNSGLRMDSALNLDGGRSTGLGVRIPGHEELVQSYVPLPVVLAVYTK